MTAYTKTKNNVKLSINGLDTEAELVALAKNGKGMMTSDPIPYQQEQSTDRPDFKPTDLGTYGLLHFEYTGMDKGDVTATNIDEHDIYSSQGDIIKTGETLANISGNTKFYGKDFYLTWNNNSRVPSDNKKIPFKNLFICTYSLDAENSATSDAMANAALKLEQGQPKPDGTPTFKDTFYDARNKPISHLANPVNANDAVNKASLDAAKKELETSINNIENETKYPDGGNDGDVLTRTVDATTSPAQFSIKWAKASGGDNLPEGAEDGLFLGVQDNTPTWMEATTSPIIRLNVKSASSNGTITLDDKSLAKLAKIDAQKDFQLIINKTSAGKISFNGSLMLSIKFKDIRGESIYLNPKIDGFTWNNYNPILITGQAFNRTDDPSGTKTNITVGHGNSLISGNVAINSGSYQLSNFGWESLFFGVVYETDELFNQNKDRIPTGNKINLLEESKYYFEFKGEADNGFTPRDFSILMQKSGINGDFSLKTTKAYNDFLIPENMMGRSYIPLSYQNNTSFPHNASYSKEYLQSIVDDISNGDCVLFAKVRYNYYGVFYLYIGKPRDERVYNLMGYYIFYDFYPSSLIM